MADDETAELYDPRTGLAGRDLFRDRLEHGCERASRDERLLGLMNAQIEGLDPIDPSFRDRLLQAAAMRMKSCVRKVDTLARLDENRFAAIIEGATHAGQVTEIANKLVLQLDQPFVFEGTQLKVTGSVGVSLFPLDATDADRLVWNAETAMLKAHNDGGNAYRLFDQDHPLG
jgi:diguanylate cyclase (GGDEF)-like protein